MPGKSKSPKKAHKGHKQRKPISKAGARRILKDAGAKKVSKDAAEELQRQTEAFAEQQARQAVALAKHSKRKTIFEKDVKGAY